MNSKTSFIKKVKEYIIVNGLIKRGDHVVAAFSAGIDSAVMVHVLAELRSVIGFRLSVGHFNHQLRPESVEEEIFVRDICAALGVPCFVGTEDIAARAKGKNLQETARKERYAFLRRVMVEQKANKVATAHHRMDQAETVLLHLLRGSGLEGLAAMYPVEGYVIRPLLGMDKEDIIRFAAENDIDYRDDQSNFSLKYLRNKIRLELLPQLAEYNLQIVDALAQTAEICREENSLLDELAQDNLAGFWLDEENALDNGFDDLPLAIRRRVLRKAFVLVAGEAAELSFDQTEAALNLKEEKSLSLTKGYNVYRRGKLYFCKGAMPELEHHYDEYKVECGKETVLGNWGWAYTAEIANSALLPNQGNKKQELFQHTAPNTKNWAAKQTISVPKEWLGGDLIFRTRREGDILFSTNKNGKRKLKELFIDAQIPPYQREGYPLLLKDGEIIWVPGLWQKPLMISKKENMVIINAKQVL
jgi:tRNA(Ile)-lysidine synthase